jgi:hypothetical protein
MSRYPRLSTAHGRLGLLFALLLAVVGLGACSSPPSPSQATTSATAPTTTTLIQSVADRFACARAPSAPPPNVLESLKIGLDGVNVDVVGTAATSNSQPSLSEARIMTSGGGVPPTNESITPPNGDDAVSLSSIDADQHSNDPLCLAQFPGTSQPTALLGLYTGGAHCCYVLRALIPAATSWTSIDADLGNADASIHLIGGSPLIVTSDNAFAYTFTDFAGSALPVELLSVTNGRFENVTGAHLSVVAADAAQWQKAIPTAPNHDDLGLIAAWTADECRLGRQVQAYTEVAALEAKGQLTGITGQGTGPVPWPTGASFVAALQTFLVQHGYCESGP